MMMTQRHTKEEMTVSLKENRPGGEEIFKLILEYLYLKVQQFNLKRTFLSCAQECHESGHHYIK